MTVEIPGSEPGRQPDRLVRLIPGRMQRGYPHERMRPLSIGGRVLRVAVRAGDPGWPPLLLCNGIGASLELLQPFVDALDTRRPVVRFDMPGIGGSPAPVLPYHRLIPGSTLHVYSGGHLELAVEAERIAPVAEAFLTRGGTEDDPGR